TVVVVMAPALTKTLKDGHGIHLSSPPASSDGRATADELESLMRPMDDGDLQKMWLSLSPFPSLDSPRLPALSPAGQSDAVLLPGPASLLGLLSFNKGPRDPPQVACVLPGVPDVFLVPVPEHNNQEACLLPAWRSAASECGPDGGDVHHSPLALTTVPPPYSLGEVKHQGCAPFFAPPPVLTQEKVAGTVGPLLSLARPCGGRTTSGLRAPRAALEEALREQFSRQAGLHSRAQRLRRRLQVLLGEHALLHCDQQLEGLKKHRQLGGVPSLDSPGSTWPGAPSRVDHEAHFSRLELSEASSSLSELSEFSRSSLGVLRGLEEALDSEATASSSSDEEQEADKGHSKTRTSPGFIKLLHGSNCPPRHPVPPDSCGGGGRSSCERRWLEERAELGSRWSWLQLRLATLEGKTQQLMELHKHIRSTKGGVVLAESQPLTDRQIQQTLLREMAGLSCTASDADAEPCSPTRLLHNIERQSAQLSQIVNSLMPPLSFSPLSKQPHTWKGKRAFTSAQNDVFVPGTSKRRRLRLFKADVSCVCARTRPLVTYHKPKLFTLSAGRLQDSGKSTLFSSLLSSSSCSCCSFCDPVVLCSDPDCSSSGASSSRTPSSTTHPASFPSFDTPLSHHLIKSTAREEWSQRPLVISIQPSSPSHYGRRSSTPLHNSHKYKQHARHHKSRVMGLSPIRTPGSARSQHRRASQRKRKRRLIEDEEDVLYQLCDRLCEDSSDEVLLEESYTQVSRKQVSQGFVRKRQGESVYNIDNIVIPMSLSKVEKLQYKDILTPSWRVVDASSLMNEEAEKEDNNEEGQVVEDLTDEVFARRHLALEQREKLLWPSWGKRKCCSRPKRSGSRLSGGGGGMCTSGEESSVESSCAQLDTDEPQSSEEWRPRTPWEPRVFPLDGDKGEALLSENPEEVSSGWSECSSASATSKNSSSRLPPAQSSGATLPPGGQSRNRTSNGS
ncbi:hypothetical protein L3Q82_017392, partial [Scortum barcoo]